jgi:hypothetical protein
MILAVVHMLQLWLIWSIVLMLSSCDNHGKATDKDRELPVLVDIIKSVANDMAEMGFPLDLDRVNIQIHDPNDVAALFNKISDESQREVSAYTPFGPKVGGIDLQREPDPDTQNARLAFYDPNSKSIIFTTGASTRLGKGYLAHELAHVYQDQKWGFDTIWSPYQDHPSRELFNITQFIIEGHAELVRQTYEQRDAKDHREISALSTTLGKYAEKECIECFSVKSLVNLPYSLGLRFLVHQFRSGGWPLVESYFTNLPSSTEQMIHPKKLGKDEPQVVDLPTFSDSSIKTKLALDGSLGEAFLLSKLLSMPMPVKEAFESASGFDGDNAQLYKTAGGKEALVWRIVFDRNLDAQQLEASLNRLGKPFSIMRTGQVVDWIVSDDYQIANKLQAFLSKTPQSVELNLQDEQTTVEQEITMKNEQGLLINPYYD